MAAKRRRKRKSRKKATWANMLGPLHKGGFKVMPPRGSDGRFRKRKRRRKSKRSR